MYTKQAKFFSRLGRILSGRGVQIKFKDRIGAADALAIMLRSSFKDISNNANVVVLGIPRGGIVIADAIATKLLANFGIIISRKLRHIHNKEQAIGAIVEDGTAYFDQYFIDLFKISEEYIEQEKLEQLKEIQRRKAVYGYDFGQFKIKGMTVILVDDGVATGSTIIAAARWIKKREPESLIIAIPVAQSQVIRNLEREADEVVALTTPHNFITVGQFYQNFEPVSDEQILEILSKRRNI